MTEETENGGFHHFTLSLDDRPKERDMRQPSIIDNRTSCIAASIRRNFIASFSDIIDMGEDEMDNEILDGVLDGNRIDYDVIDSAISEETEESSSVIHARNQLHSISQSIRLHDAFSTLDEEEEETEEVVDEGNLKQFLEHPTTTELSPDLHDSLVHYVTETSDTIRGWADDLGGGENDQDKIERDKIRRDKIKRGKSDRAAKMKNLFNARVQSERVIRSERGLQVRTLLKEKAESARDFNDAALGTLERKTRRDSIIQSIDVRKKSNFEKNTNFEKKPKKKKAPTR